MTCQGVKGLSATTLKGIELDILGGILIVAHVLPQMMSGTERSEPSKDSISHEALCHLSV
jgi:hypothetical protein